MRKQNLTLIAINIVFAFFIWGAAHLNAQFNCSGGTQNCPGTPTGTGVVVLQTSPTLTTPSVTGTITSSTTNNNVILANTVSGAATGYAIITILNTSGNAYVGLNGSNANGLITGGNAYATTVATNNATDLNFGTNGATNIRVASGGTVYAYNLSAEPGTKSAMCHDDSTGQLETNPAASCTFSSLKGKDPIRQINCKEARRIVKDMKQWIFKDKDGADIERYGFAAEWTVPVDPKLVYYSRTASPMFKRGDPVTIDYERYSAVLTRYLQCL